MGIFSKLWNGVKGVFTGILNLFSPILKPLNKILGSKWGKALMLAVSAFTFGTALLAGAQGFAAGLAGTATQSGSFLQAFVQGGKAFVSSLLGIEGQGAAGGATTTGAENAAALTEGAVQSAIDPLAKNMTEGAVAGAESVIAGANQGVNSAADMLAGKPVGGALSAAAGTAGPTKSLLQAGGQLATRTLPAATEGGGVGNWLSKAASKAWEFAKSPEGANIIGGALEGQYAGSLEESRQRYGARYDRMWQDPAQTQEIRDLSANFGPDVPADWIRNPAEVSNQRIQGFTPTIPYRRAPVGAGG